MANSTPIERTGALRRSNVPDQRLARRPSTRPQTSERRIWIVELADDRAQDRLELRVERVDPRLDGWISRYANRPRLVEVSRLIDARLRARIEHQPDAREAHALTEILNTRRRSDGS